MPRHTLLPRAAILAEPETASDYYLKTELYARISANSEIFDFLQARSLDGVWYLDLEHPENQWMSARFKELFGYQEHEVPHSSAWWQENILAEDLPATLVSLSRHCADPSIPCDQTVRYRHKDGSIVWVRCRGLAIRDASGKPIRMLGAHTDVTHIKRTEERLRLLHEASPEMSFVADMETATITECNQALREHCGESLIGASLLGLWADDSAARAKDAFRSLASQGKLGNIQLTLKGKSGVLLAVRLSAETVRDEVSKRLFLRAWCRDIRSATVADLAARKGIESALLDNEYRFRQLTECLPQLIWTCAPEGTCDYLSPQWVRYTGVSEAKQLEFGWMQQIHPDDRAGLMEDWSACVRTGSPFRYEYRIRRHDGAYCWFDTRGIPLRNQENHIVKWFGASTDITDLKHVEADQRFLLQLGVGLQSANGPQAIAETATRLAEYFNAARCSLYSIDSARDLIASLHTSTGNGPATHPEGSRLSAWANDDVVHFLAMGNALAIEETASHPFTAAQYRSAFQPAGVEALIAVPLRREGSLVSFLIVLLDRPKNWSPHEIELARSAGERIWLAYEAARALAAEREMHATLAASERRLQLALQSAAIGIWEYDFDSGINDWDVRSRRIFGFAPDLKIDRATVMACIHPDDREAVQESIQAYLDPAAPGHFETVYRIVTCDNRGIRHVFAQGQLVYASKGELRRPLRAVGTLQDVTCLKQGEQALRRANLELERFAYAAAHDLQEPLRNVGLASQMLAIRYQGQFDHDADTLLETAVEGATRMQAMVKDLLAYSRAVSFEEAVVLFADPNAVLTLVFKRLLTVIEETHAAITWEVLPPLRMSEFQLLQILENLIGNSLKYCGPKAPVIHIAGVRRAGECVLSVKDNGIGIAPEYHDRAFGVFKRLHNRDLPGTGMGLALSKRIVEHYGGRIWIESEVGEGVTVLFTLPLAH